MVDYTAGGEMSSDSWRQGDQAVRPINELKKDARRTLRSHYILLVIIAAVMVIAGGTTSVTRSIVLHLNNPTEAQELLNGGTLGSGTAVGVAEDIYNDEFRKGYDAAEKEIREKQSSQAETIGISGSKGALASIANEFSSGMVIYRIAQAVQGVVHSASATVRIMIIGAVLAYVLVWMFLLNIMSVITARMVLEARTYSNVPVSRARFLADVHCWKKTAVTMCVRSVYQILWNLTVVGGVIKHFSYMLVPYIVAENPELSCRQAITLSRKMMDGHKKEVFLYQLSFIGWMLLGPVTFGIAEFLWASPYYRSTEAEIYADLRRLAIENEVEGIELLNDNLLYEKAPSGERTAAYKDVQKRRLALQTQGVTLSGLNKFAAEWLGIWLGTATDKIRYQKSERELHDISEEMAEAAGEAYPMRLCPRDKVPDDRAPERMDRGTHSIVWTRCYSLWSLIAMFFMFSFIGWCWEVSLHLITQHIFVNRGALHGPWLPIYGIGGVVILMLLTRVRKKPAAEFSAAVILAGIVEYSIARGLETGALHSRYWDYHGYFLNLDGRICAESILTFGIMGLLIVYVVAPLADTFMDRIPVKRLAAFCLCLIAAISADIYVSAANPNTGNGVEQDITAGAWPTTFTVPDTITINGIVTHNTEEALKAESKDN